MRTTSSSERRNLILSALSPTAYARMKPEVVALKVGEVLCEPWTRASHVYFPGDSIVSLIAVAGAKGLEVGMVGRQGMVGVSLASGLRESPTRALVQGAGSAMRLSVSKFATELSGNLALHHAVSRYADVAIATAMQIAACNNVHSVDQRCARWLLMMSDTLGKNEFLLTQSFLAQMLGVRRTGVSETAANLRRRRLITYRRGRMAIVDRAGLIALSCNCYDTISRLGRADLAAPSVRALRRSGRPPL